MKVAIVEVLSNPLSVEIKEFFLKQGASVFSCKVQEVPQVWANVDLLIFVASLGVAFRTCAPLLRNKMQDPGVLVVDSEGNFCIVLCGGHAKGANRVSRLLARHLGAEAVVTTASCTFGVLSPEEIALRLGASLEGDSHVLRVILRRLAKEEVVDFYFEPALCPPPFPGYRCLPWQGVAPEREFVFFGERILPGAKHIALRPKSLVLGVGFRSTVSLGEIERALQDFFTKHAYALASLREIVTLHRKTSRLLPLAEKLGVPVTGVYEEELRKVQGEFSSPCAMKYLGIPGLVEPALALRGCTLLVGKTVYPGITFALGRKCEKWQGFLYLVSLGTGGRENLTPQALSALEDSEWILGYQKYLNTLPLRFQRRILWEHTRMGEEVKRAELAVQLAARGNRVALVSSGDVGVFGIVSPALELALRYGVAWKIVPGVTACLYAASRLGSPLVGGFAVVSLSDYLVPWERIQHDLEHLAQTDLAVAVYNIVGKGKEEKITFLKEIFSLYRSASLPVGIVWSSGKVDITPLQELDASALTMQCTLILPPRGVRVESGTLVVERGYPV
ncbi:cobalamin biosynthesis protein [Candidatus Caldatribacterium sp.]|uniref:cobalamin biosynthesis protein n=1 Tax=Candidatus Caldatribacterium sp. TaxID=2282143 RepID=UPI002995953C|nr:bifunctional cobalt-precorrin 5A hydrolase/precorrin-3B C(17)-methyltransferase [Candidatus Caldatribacterium sp.]MDW8080291.1 cobalamin biosynthesis protein [Candidatus Calescibacterium sp.]